MKKSFAAKVFVFSIILVISGSHGFAQDDDDRSFASRYLGGGAKFFVETMPEDALISASSAVGSPAHHRHLVRPGLVTTYMVRLLNTEAESITFDLELSPPPKGWTAGLERSSLSVAPEEQVYVMLELRPSSKLEPGRKARVTVTARTSSGRSEEITLEAETTLKRKIYFVSIDSLHPGYIELNSKGNGPGGEGDWLMPNLKEFLAESTFYPDHKVHLLSATDMNHASYLSGALPGRLGFYSVNIFINGFDENGIAILETTPCDLMYYGPDRKPVTTIFNVVKDPAYGGNAEAFTAYVSGKAWVPEHYRNPIFGLDRIGTVNDYPDYVTPSTHKGIPFEAVWRAVQIQFGKVKDHDYYLWEDPYSIDQVIEIVDNEDPDVFYILLGGVDAAGHTFGSAFDLEEWKSRRNPDNLANDVSRVNRRANRLGMINTVRTADQELGRFLAFLRERGTYDEAYIIVESDHHMETNFFKGPKAGKIMKKAGYSRKHDYFFFTATQLGHLFVKPGKDADEMVPAIEGALEDFRMKNPLTGEFECPMIVINRDEMKTGVDEVTGERITLPMELYSEYYINHRKDGELMWPDLIVLAKKYYQFPLMGVGLANVGLGKMDIQLPRINVMVGGHGGPSTQPSLLSIKGPGIPEGKVSYNTSWPADVAPTLYILEGYEIPVSVQGKKLEW